MKHASWILLFLVSTFLFVQFCPFAHATTTTLHPTGDGSHLQCTVYPASPTTHFDKVNETTPNDATNYVRASNAAPQTADDSYTKPACGITAGSTITSLVISTRIYTLKTDNVYAHVHALLVNGTGTHQLGGTNTAGVWTTKTDTYVLSPFTGLAWTIAEIDAMQIGCECTSIETPMENVAPAYCSTVWIDITWSAPSGTNYTVQTTFANSVAFTKGEKVAYKLSNGFSASNSFSLLHHSTFNIVASFVPASNWLLNLQAEYFLNTAFESTSTFESLETLGYIITSTFTAGISFLMNIQTAFSLSIGFIPESTFSILTQTAYAISSTFTSSSSFVLNLLHHIGITAYNVLLSFTANIGFILNLETEDYELFILGIFSLLLVFILVLCGWLALRRRKK